MSHPEARLRRRIAAAGPLSFAEFMEEALYGEEGYYARAPIPLGEAGDYVTGSSLSPLFGRATARLLRRLDGALGRPAMLFEAGYGNGAHLAAVAAALAQDGSAGTARQRLLGWDRVTRPLAQGVEAVGELAELAPGAINGLVFSYELFDALPVHRLVRRADGSLGELYVTTAGDSAAAAPPAPERPPPPGELARPAAASGGRSPFAWHEGPLSQPHLADLVDAEELEVGQVADLAPGWVPLYRRLARRLGRGLLVTCDYGFDRRRLLDPRVRRHGTLACYSRQRVHRNPFVRVGRQDLTAHVDFTALRRAGEAAGLTTVAFTRQAPWLTACGLFDLLAGADAETRQQAMALLDGAGMGSEMRVLVQSRGVEAGSVLDLSLLG